MQRSSLQRLGHVLYRMVDQGELLLHPNTRTEPVVARIIARFATDGRYGVPLEEMISHAILEDASVDELFVDDARLAQLMLPAVERTG